MAQAEFHLGGVVLIVTVEIVTIPPIDDPEVMKTSAIPTSSVRIEQSY